MDKFLIEYQGKQHYEPINFGSKTKNAIESLNSTKRRDQIKRNWCQKNKIPLIEIPYWEFDKIEEHITKQMSIYL
jgi:hypothetical protein